MKIKDISLLALLIVLLNACYEDKGNYDYKELNNFKIKLNPAPADETFVYLLNQPSVDTLLYTITAEVEQTITKGEGNLEYLWTSTINEKTDSIHTKTITLRIPPNKKSVFELMCKVRDKNLNIEYYQNVTVKTEIPFHDSWFLLHGDMGNRKIGAIQWNSDGKPRWEDDIMLVSKRPQITNATDIAYGMMGTSIQGDFLTTERLFVVVGTESVASFLPFEVKPSNTPWNITRPVDNPNVKPVSIIAHGRKEYVGMLDEDAKFYWARTGPFFYTAKQSADISNYRVDKFYINEEGIATLWDNTAKRFMYYKIGNSNYNPWNGGNRQDATNDTKIVYYTDISKNEMQNKTVLWAGRGAKTTKSVETSTFIVKDENTKQCFLYNFIYDDGKKDNKKAPRLVTRTSADYELMKLKRDTLVNLKFDDKAVFATSNAFNEQLFYSNGSELYRCVLGTGEAIPLINFDGNIKYMRFRVTYDYGVAPEVKSKNLQTIGVVIEGANGKDEFKEIVLDNAGDIKNVVNYNFEYGKIEKIEFTVTQRRFDL